MNPTSLLEVGNFSLKVKLIQNRKKKTPDTQFTPYHYEELWNALENFCKSFVRLRVMTFRSAHRRRQSTLAKTNYKNLSDQK